jgi:hypothetical protein
MKEQYREKLFEAAVSIVFICVLFVVSNVCAEFIYLKMFPKQLPEKRIEVINVPPVRDTVYFDMCSSCIHFGTCIKCQKYEQELIKKGLIEP